MTAVVQVAREQHKTVSTDSETCQQGQEEVVVELQLEEGRGFGSFHHNFARNQAMMLW